MLCGILDNWWFCGTFLRIYTRTCMWMCTIIQLFAAVCLCFWFYYQHCLCATFCCMCVWNLKEREIWINEFSVCIVCLRLYFFSVSRFVIVIHVCWCICVYHSHTHTHRVKAAQLGNHKTVRAMSTHKVVKQNSFFLIYLLIYLLIWIYLCKFIYLLYFFIYCNYRVLSFWFFPCILLILCQNFRLINYLCLTLWLLMCRTCSKR